MLASRENKYPRRTKRLIRTTSIIAIVMMMFGGFWFGYAKGTAANRFTEAYTANCRVFLERATRASTANVARGELRPAFNWLWQNQLLTNDFEYRNLADALRYLEAQPALSPIPQSIQESLSAALTQADASADDRRQPSSWDHFIFIGLTLVGPLCLITCTELFVDLYFHDD